MALNDDELAVSYEIHNGQVCARHPCGMVIFAGLAPRGTRHQAWESTLDWPTVGPKLIAALEEISWALISEKPAAAQSIIDKVFTEIGKGRARRPGRRKRPELKMY